MKQACSLESMVDAVLSEMKRRGNAKNTIERHERGILTILRVCPNTRRKQLFKSSGEIFFRGKGKTISLPRTSFHGAV